MMFPNVNGILALIISLIIIQYPERGAGDDIGTNFFLKASKSVPRIGRRSMDADNHFLKASKSVPRIGRRGALNGRAGMDDAKGYPVVRNFGPEVYITETGEPLWSDFEKAYESSPRMEKFHGFGQDFVGVDPYWQRLKKDYEMEEPRIQAEVL